MIALVALATIVPLISGQIDLSVGPAAGMCGLVAAELSAQHGYPGLSAIVLGIAAGALIGLVHGVLVAYLGVDAIVATLGTSTLIEAFVYFYSRYRRLKGRKKAQQAWPQAVKPRPRFFAHWVWVNTVPIVW